MVNEVSDWLFEFAPEGRPVYRKVQNRILRLHRSPLHPVSHSKSVSGVHALRPQRSQNRFILFSMTKNRYPVNYFLLIRRPL